jgi:LysM repeat protein
MRRITLVLTALIVIATLFISPAEAGIAALPAGWSFTVVEYCRNGFTVFAQTPAGGIADTNNYRVAITATSPVTSPRDIFNVTGPSAPQTGRLFYVYWTAPQSPGTSVSVTANLFINGADAGGGTDPSIVLDCSIPPPDDGRVNNIIVDPEQTAAVYCRTNGIEVLKVIGNQPVTALFATVQEINAVGVPRVNTLIKSGLDVRLYRLTSGEFQINAPGLQGKEYVFTWSGCPAFTSNAPAPSAIPYTPYDPYGTTGTLVYIVQRGDTLARIAQRFGVSLAVLAGVNQIADINRIEVGQLLVIPTAFTVVPYTPPVTVVTTYPTVTTSGRTHVVQRGENLYRIALRYGVSLSALASVNGISNPNLIYVGQVLKIP